MYIVFMAFLAAQQKPSETSVSDSVPPQQRPQGIFNVLHSCDIMYVCMYAYCLEQQFKHSLSFPAVSHPNKTPYQNRQHSDDDVRKKLVYNMDQMSIAEENPAWSLPVNFMCSWFNNIQ